MALLCLMVLELGLYVGCFICGIVTAASVTVTQGQFAGKCILYGRAVFNTTKPSLTMLNFGSQSLCYFVTAISAIIAVYCFSLFLYWVYTSCVDRDNTRGRLWVNLTIAVSIVYLFFLLVTGCILKIGRNQLCESIIHLPNITRCEDAQSKPWSAPYNGKHFFSSLHSAEVSVWVNFFLWLLVAAGAVIQRCRGSEFVERVDTSGDPSEREPFFRPPSRPE
ncbi:hypothetical protein GJAV_G00200470 [Gymnothorax javanicus]|nr:hypothetical protein GJAV_G00200470 [Gymnothorax javanicus]